MSFQTAPFLFNHYTISPKPFQIKHVTSSHHYNCIVKAYHNYIVQLIQATLKQYAIPAYPYPNYTIPIQTLYRSCSPNLHHSSMKALHQSSSDTTPAYIQYPFTSIVPIPPFQLSTHTPFSDEAFHTPISCHILREGGCEVISQIYKHAIPSSLSSQYVLIDKLCD